MFRKTITRKDLIEAVRRATRLSSADAAVMVKQFLTEITDGLERGENVQLSSFGSFVVRDKKSRVGRNPKTGQPVPISARRVLTFKPSGKLTRRMNAK